MHRGHLPAKRGRGAVQTTHRLHAATAAANDCAAYCLKNKEQPRQPRQPSCRSGSCCRCSVNYSLHHEAALHAACIVRSCWADNRVWSQGNHSLAVRRVGTARTSGDPTEVGQNCRRLCGISRSQHQTVSFDTNTNMHARRVYLYVYVYGYRCTSQRPFTSPN